MELKAGDVKVADAGDVTPSGATPLRKEFEEYFAEVINPVGIHPKLREVVYRQELRTFMAGAVAVFSRIVTTPSQPTLEVARVQEVVDMGKELEVFLTELVQPEPQPEPIRGKRGEA